MDIADWNGLALRRWLRSAERFTDAAIACGLDFLNTSGSRVIASLCAVTSADQRRLVFPEVRRGARFVRVEVEERRVVEARRLPPVPELLVRFAVAIPGR